MIGIDERGPDKYLTVVTDHKTGKIVVDHQGPPPGESNVPGRGNAQPGIPSQVTEGLHSIDQLNYGAAARNAYLAAEYKSLAGSSGIT